MQTLQAEGKVIYAIEQIEKSISLQDFVVDKKTQYALVFGNEVEGVSEEALKYVAGAIEIPQFGTKHSLNVSVSAGILVWDYYSKIKGKVRDNPL